MRDERLRVFRAAVDALLESLDAVVRLSRWSDGDAKPVPLVTAAAKLHDRLGAADRLAASRFVGTVADTAKVDAMRAAMKRLDQAHLTYRKHRASTAERTEAADALESEVSAMSALSERWA